MDSSVTKGLFCGPLLLKVSSRTTLLFPKYLLTGTYRHTAPSFLATPMHLGAHKKPKVGMPGYITCPR